MYLADDFRTLVYFTQDSLKFEDIHTGQKFEYLLMNGRIPNEQNHLLLDCIHTMTLGHIKTSEGGKKEINILVTLSNQKLKEMADSYRVQGISAEPAFEGQNFTYFILKARIFYDGDPSKNIVMIEDFDWVDSDHFGLFRLVWIDLRPILDSFVNTLGFRLLKVEIHQVDNSRFRKHIIFEVVFADNTFLMGIGRVDLSGRVTIFEKFTRQHRVGTGKIYPVHELDKFFMISDSRLQINELGYEDVRCWSISQKKKCMKMKLRLPPKFQIGKLLTSTKVLFQSKLNDTVILAGGINRGNPIAVMPKLRQVSIPELKSTNISGAYPVEVKIPSLNHLEVENRTITNVKFFKIPKGQCYLAKEMFFYRSDDFTQFDGCAILMNDRQDYPESGASLGDLILLKLAIGESTELQVVSHNQKKILKAFKIKLN